MSHYECRICGAYGMDCDCNLPSKEYRDYWRHRIDTIERVMYEEEKVLLDKVTHEYELRYGKPPKR